MIKGETRKPKSNHSFLLVVLRRGMEEKRFYGYTKREWLRLFICYLVFLFFGGIEASEGVYYALMKEELEIPYKIQGYIVSMGSWSFIIGAPIVGYLMTVFDVKPIIVGAFVAYFVGYSILYFSKQLWPVFIALFIEGLGGVLLDVGMNTLSTDIFTYHRGVMMNYLHFFYGLGSAIGPTYSNFIKDSLNMGYRGVFVGLAIPIIIGFFFTLFSKLSLKQAQQELKDTKVVEVEVTPSPITKTSDVKPEDKVKAEVSTLPTTIQSVPTGVVEPTTTIQSVPTGVINVIVEGESAPTEPVESTEPTESTQPVESTESSQSTQPTESTTHKQSDSVLMWKNFLSPLIWLLGLNMGAVYAIESVTVNWGPLYLKDVFGVSDSNASSFLSLFYVFYTVARLFTGYVVDYLGDMNSVIAFNIVLIIFYIICFLIGRPAIWVLSFSGFIISPFYPTAITVPMEVLGKEADKAISVILCIALIVNWVIQVVIGYVNEYIGYQWGYRILSIAMSVLMILCILSIQLYLKNHKKQNKC